MTRIIAAILLLALAGCALAPVYEMTPQGPLYLGHPPPDDKGIAWGCIVLLGCVL